MAEVLPHKEKTAIDIMGKITDSSHKRSALRGFIGNLVQSESGPAAVYQMHSFFLARH